MNNNQTQQTNQPNPNRFHLKTWQWLSVLIIAAGIAGGVFVYDRTHFSREECLSTGGRVVNTLDESACDASEENIGYIDGLKCDCICCALRDKSCNEIENEITRSLTAINYCQEDLDCIVYDFGLFGQRLINKEVIEIKSDIINKIQDYEKKCPSDAISVADISQEALKCIKGKCAVERWLISPEEQETLNEHARVKTVLAEKIKLWEEQGLYREKVIQKAVEWLNAQDSIKEVISTDSSIKYMFKNGQSSFILF
ncbi:MAG: hypothetical protein ABH896_04580 [Candidatus Jacksonbacteria bacterium]